MTTLATLQMAEYVALAVRLPPPTEDQRENFADFVSGAHSWYKHIPVWQPGVPFHFFIDPSAGCERRVTVFRKVKVTPRVKRGFHYSWIPTPEYRERFGYLTYSCAAGTKASEVKFGFMVTSTDGIAAIPKDGRLYGLPPEVLQAGSVNLTSVIHPLSATYAYWDELGPAKYLKWPTESGGQGCVQKIIERCQAMRHESFEERKEKRILISEEGFVDAELYELFTPERKRQQSEMINAMRRVCDLVYR